MTNKKFIKLCIAKSYAEAITALRSEVAAHVLKGQSASSYFVTPAFEKWIKTLIISGADDLLLEFISLGLILSNEQALCVVNSSTVTGLIKGLPEIQLPLIYQYLGQNPNLHNADHLRQEIAERLLAYTPDPKGSMEIRTIALASFLLEDTTRPNHQAWLLTIAKQNEIITRVIAMQPLLLNSFPLDFQQKNGDYILERHLLNQLLTGKNIDLTEPGLKLLLECGSVLAEKLKTNWGKAKSKREFTKDLWSVAICAYASNTSIWLTADFGVNGLTAISKAFKFNYKDLTAKTINDLLINFRFDHINLLVALEYPLDIEQVLRLIERSSDQDSWYYLIQQNYATHSEKINKALFLHHRMDTVKKLMQSGQFIVHSKTLKPLIKYLYAYPLGFLPNDVPEVQILLQLSEECKLELVSESLACDNISLAVLLTKHLSAIPLGLATKTLLLEQTHLFQVMIPKLAPHDLNKLKIAARLQGYKPSFA